jgi:hypothetical protein
VQEITGADLSRLNGSFTSSMVHLETRDVYGTDVELPHLARWARGEPDDHTWLEAYCAKIRGQVAAGRTARRAKVVSEPLSDYQRWAHSITPPLVDAGEDIAWVPRQAVSTLCLPGNDYYLFDDRQVVFLHYAGSGLNTAFTTTTDPAVASQCREAFEQVWALSIPHRDYRPD